MKQERIIWAGGINRSRDPRYIESHEQYDAYDVEVVEQGTLSKRKGFGRWRTDGNSVINAVVRGIALMYDSDENRYLFVFYDGSNGGSGTDLWVEKAGGTPLIIEDFFPSKGYRVRSAVFGDRIYFVNGVDRPRWYKEYDGAAHVWGIAGVPSPARRPTDESTYDFEVTRAQYAEHITASEDFGIDPPGIWQYKQAIGYYGKISDERVEESNAGPASRLFICQFNTAEALGTQLQGYVKKGIPIGIADFDDLILDAGEPGGQDYEDEIRWTRIYRRIKMYSDELFSPFEFLVEMKKGWPTSIRDVYSRDSAVVAPTTRVQIPVSHHITSANNRLFLGRIEKELFTQPGLPADFRVLTTYKPNFSYRMPVTVHSTNPKTLTGAAIPLRFQDSSATDHVATPPSGGEAWTGAYIDTSLDLNGTTGGWYQMMFVDEDGVTPLGFAMISKDTNVVTFLVEMPEIAAGGSRTIYIYFEDSQLASGGNPEDYAGEPGDWESVAHYPLLSSDHLMLIDFENWETGMAMTAVTQKRSLAYIEQGPAALGTGVAKISKAMNDYFFNDTTFNMGAMPTLNVDGDPIAGDADCIQVKFYPPSDSADILSFVFWVSFGQSSGHGGSVRLADPDNPTTEISVLVTFADGAAGTLDVTATGYFSGGSSSTSAINIDIASASERYLMAVVVANDELTLYIVQGDLAGYPGEGAAWDTSGWVKESDAVAFTNSLQMYSAAEAFIAVGGDISEAVHGAIRFKDIHVLTREIDGFDELISMWNRDGYWPDYGLATAEDRESAIGEKRPDRMYFSQLNQPNSVETADFRDMGELGRPIQGIKGIHNRLFVFDENKVRALFSAGAEKALTLASGDTTMWNLSQDLTGEIGGLGVLAPDSLVTMEFAGRDGVGFLSRRGFYFFDGQNFVHISEKVDELIRYHIDNYGKDFSALFIKEKRQLLITPTDILDVSPRIQVANMKFATDVGSIIWTEFGIRMKFGVELDEYIDDGDFVFVKPYISAQAKAQVLKLEGNTGTNTYVDILDDGAGDPSPGNVTCGLKSKYFDLFDAEVLHVDIENEVATPSSYYDVKLFSDISGAMAEVVNLDNPANGENRFPIGTNARTFMVKITENSSSAIILRTIDLYFNVHRRRRV